MEFRSSFIMKIIKDYVKKGKKPRAIILVHLYGYYFKINEILNIFK